MEKFQNKNGKLKNGKIVHLQLNKLQDSTNLRLLKGTKNIGNKICGFQ